MKPATILFMLGIAATIAAGAVQPALADEIIFPDGRLERDGEIDIVYRLDAPATGDGVLSVEWTDALGRLVERRELPVAFDGGTDAVFSLDLGRAVATGNRLRTRLSLAGIADGRETDAVFFAPPGTRGWADYQVIMWQNQGFEQFAALKELGFSAGKVYATPDQQVAGEFVDPLLDTDLRWYVENIATDFYSAYHRWHPEKPNNWRFLEARELYKRNPDDIAAFLRDPSLSDPVWLQKIRERLARTVRSYAPFRPLFYNLADEPGIAQTASFWDFDLSEHSLAGMRDWLREQYGSLDALNAQWGSSFATWDQVMPMTTREAVTRADDNFSAWADFKAWMDVAFARAIRAGTDAVHDADPTARAAIEGAQIPGWGGYDYSLLAHAVDVMEIYDFAENVEIARSLNPELIILATLGGSGPRAEHAVWRELLRGNRGVIFWDDKRQVVGPDASVGERGRQAAEWIGRIRSGVGALVIGSERHVDPIAMLYSPASLRTQWMVEVKPSGQGWSERDVDSEYQDNPIRVASRRFRWAIEHMGLQHRMISPQQIEGGSLRDGDYHVLILPHALALSPAEAEEIRRFARQGGTVVAVGEPGVFDQHSRRLPRPLLADLFPADPSNEPAVTTIGKGKAIRLADDPAGERDMREQVGPILAAAGILPRFPVSAPPSSPGDRPLGDVETYVFRNGGVTIVALQRNPPRLPAAGAAESAPAADEKVILTLPGRSHLYDILERADLGRSDRVELTLDAVEPTLLALADTALPAPVLTAPARLRQGDSGTIEIGWTGPSPAALQILRLEVTDPAGRLLRHYSGNLTGSGGTIDQPLPLALNDPVGDWKIRVTDVLSGQVAEATLEVVAR
jgi:hypothetical protein